jgi:hypothetical protein
MALSPDRTVLMVMVDALRHDYVTEEDAPFLHGLAHRGGHGSLVPSFGFEPDGAYLAGLDPEECDGGAQYWLKPGDRVFHLTGLFGLLDRIPHRGWRRNVRRATRLVAQLVARTSFVRKLASPSWIPYGLLARFSFPMVHFADEPDFAPGRTVFDVLRKHGGQWHFHGFPAHRVQIDVVVERYLRTDPATQDLAFLFVGDLDGIGHRFGPDSPERRAALRRVDAGLSRIHAHASRNGREVAILVFGDHGMADVRGHLDMGPVIREAGLDLCEDSYFLDSTFARFWVRDEARRQRLLARLAEVKSGHVLGEEERARYRIRYPHNYFGDVVFAVDDHLLVHPSFYSGDDAPPKGMHGYLPGCRDNESAFVVHDPRAPGLGDLGRVDMHRVFPTVLDMLGLLDRIDVPHGARSLLS